MWKLYTCRTCFRHFWKNKQLHIGNYKVRKSHVGPRASLASWVLKQSALVLVSKSMLWSLNQSLHLGEKKNQPERKQREFETRVHHSDSVQILSAWALSAFQSWRDFCKACICTGRISLIHISGARLTLCNTLSDLDFWNHVLMKSVPWTMSSFSSSSGLSQLVHLLKFNMLLLFFFFPEMSLHKRGSWKETAAPIPAGAAAATDSDLCTCMELGDWRLVRGWNILEHQGFKARGMDGSRAGKLDTPLLTWRAWDHTWFELVKRLPGWGVSWLVVNEMISWL